MVEKLVEYLSEFQTPERIALYDKILDQRTRYLTVVMEDIYQPQNASAVLRSVDCFGIQDVHIIENKNEFEVDREVSLGAAKWLTLKKYTKEKDNSITAITKIRKDGYRIVATTPHEGDVNLEEFDLLKGKVALIFGTELTGISDIVKEEADEFLKIPMYGFTESFNISVSAAIILHHLTHQLRTHTDIKWHLSDSEKARLKLDWLRRSIKKSELIEENYLKKQ